jgi:hypothetical protein
MPIGVCIEKAGTRQEVWFMQNLGQHRRLLVALVVLIAIALAVALLIAYSGGGGGGGGGGGY